MAQNTRGYLAALALTAGMMLTSVSVPVIARADGAAGRRADQEALKPYAGLVGDWRGVGQVERGRSKGAWTETAGWAWKLTNDSAALELTVSHGKHLKSALLHPGKAPGTFILDATLADGSKRVFTGKATAKDSLALKADGKATEGLSRVTITPLHDTRLLLLLESEGPAYARLGEVGYTRQGVKFAAGESGPICVVTEGRGTIQVSHKGKTYWVCCSGCRDLFNDDPEAVLAEAEARKNAKPKD